MRALFSYVGGGKVYRNSAHGKAERAVFYRRADALFALFDGGVGQADELVRDHSLVYIGFHLNRHAFQSVECKTYYLRKHFSTVKNTVKLKKNLWCRFFFSLFT